MELIGGVDFVELRKERIKTYDTLPIALDAEAVDKEVIVSGNYLYVLEATDIDTEIDIKFNEQFRSAVRMVHGRAVRTPFYRLYLSWAAQPGKTVTIALGVGQADLFEVSDVGKALEVTGDINVDSAGTVVAPKKFHDFYGSYNEMGTSVARGSVGVYNPPGSGINAFLYSIVPFAKYETSFVVSDLYILNAIAGYGQDGSFNYSGNKFLGGIDPTCRLIFGVINTTNFSANTFKPSTIYKNKEWVAGDNGRHHYFDRGFCIPPGFAVVGASGMSITEGCGLNLSWYEEPE